MSYKATARLLERAIKVLTPKGSWTQGTMARDKNRMPVRVGSPNAVQFCAAGALRCASETFSPPQYWAAYNLLKANVGRFQSVTEFNDAYGRKHDQVLKLMHKAFDEAMALAHLRKDE